MGPRPGALRAAHPELLRRPGRCEWACIDTLDFCNDITHTFQSELHRPVWPYKFKIKSSGCPNDCVASIARADLSVIGTWRDKIRVDADAVADYDSKIDIRAEVVELCPTRCIAYDSAKKKLDIDDSNCTRCMHCINVMPKALRPEPIAARRFCSAGKPRL